MNGPAPNQSFQPTANPLRGLSAAELGRYASTELIMAPTIYREQGFRLFLLSREEPRKHVHVIRAEGEAKFWLEPEIELAKNHGLSRHQLKEAEEIVGEHQNEFPDAWHQRFES